MSNKNQDFNAVDELNKEITSYSDNEEKSKLSTVKNVLKQVFLPSGTSDNKLLSAEDAYLRATYKEYTSKKKLFHDLVQRIKDRIKGHMEQNTLYTIIDIEPEMMNYTDEIVNSLSSYGYQVWCLGKNELEQLNPNVKVNKTTMFMLIMWDKVY